MLVWQKKRSNKSSEKVLSLHAPEVACIGKDKSRQPYEFGTKVSIAISRKAGLVEGVPPDRRAAMHGSHGARRLELRELKNTQGVAADLKINYEPPPWTRPTSGCRSSRANGGEQSEHLQILAVNCEATGRA